MPHQVSCALHVIRCSKRKKSTQMAFGPNSIHPNPKNPNPYIFLGLWSIPCSVALHAQCLHICKNPCQTILLGPIIVFLFKLLKNQSLPLVRYCISSVEGSSACFTNSTADTNPAEFTAKWTRQITFAACFEYLKTLRFGWCWRVMWCYQTWIDMVQHDEAAGFRKAVGVIVIQRQLHQQIDELDGSCEWNTKDIPVAEDGVQFYF